MSGEDKGMEARYTTRRWAVRRQCKRSRSNRRAGRERSDEACACRASQKDHYTHKSYGRIYTPVFEVVEFVSMTAKPMSQKQKPKHRQPKQHPHVVVAGK
jgi:hypothetical protein